MRFRVYRSLDNNSILFGIKGKFFFLTIALSLVGAVVAIIIGSFTSSIFGTAFFLLGVAVSYGITLYVQSRLSEREAMRFLAARNLPKMFLLKNRKSFFN